MIHKLISDQKKVLETNNDTVKSFGVFINWLDPLTLSSAKTNNNSLK